MPEGVPAGHEEAAVHRDGVQGPHLRYERQGVGRPLRLDPRPRPGDRTEGTQPRPRESGGGIPAAGSQSRSVRDPLPPLPPKVPPPFDSGGQGYFRKGRWEFSAAVLLYRMFFAENKI